MSTDLNMSKTNLIEKQPKDGTHAQHCFKSSVIRVCDAIPHRGIRTQPVRPSGFWRRQN